jgi:hypothetical protein
VFFIESSNPEYKTPLVAFHSIKVLKVKEAIKKLDLIVILGSQIKQQDLDTFKKDPNKKVIAYFCGNTYMITAEQLLFKFNDKHSSFYENNLDEVWYVPQQHESNLGYYKTLYKTNAIPVPFVWSPCFLQKELDDIDKKFAQGKFTKDSKYNPNKEKKNIIVMEPNINLVKTCIMPTFLTEQCYRTEIGKQKIDSLIITNAKQIIKESNFLSWLKCCSIYNDKKLKVDARFPISYVLSQHADILVSHQLCNPLNYLYLDAAYMGYPVLHNAWMCSDVGYYYEKSELFEGAKQLEYILTKHDSNLEEYNERNQLALSRYLNTNTDVINTYDILIKNIMEGKKNLGLIYNHKTNLYDNLV